MINFVKRKMFYLLSYYHLAVAKYYKEKLKEHCKTDNIKAVTNCFSKGLYHSVKSVEYFTYSNNVQLKQ